MNTAQVICLIFSYIMTFMFGITIGMVDIRKLTGKDYLGLLFWMAFIILFLVGAYHS